MIKESIKTLEELEDKVSTLEHDLYSTCYNTLEKIYELQENYVRKHHQPNFKILEFYSFGVDECFLINDNTIEVNYFDKCWDCYDSRRIRLPIEIVEDNSKIQEWFDLRVSEYEERNKERKKKIEKEEYEKYLRLKEKYENVNKKGKNTK